MYRHVAANLMTALFLVLIALAVVALWARQEYEKPGPLTEEAVFEVKRGDRLGPVADRLEEQGVVTSATLFRIGARYAGAEQGLKFGDYAVPAGATMGDVLELITSGRAITYNVTLVEGWTSWQIVERLKRVETLTGEITEIPAEGSLAPNTYDYNKGDTRQSVLDRMASAQARILEDAWLQRDPETPLRTRDEALILASIVEKETGLAEERPLVASVFVNRLNDGMQLQTDPTIIYGINRGVDGFDMGRPISRADRDGKTEQAAFGQVIYNTYQIAGLPPTPIANPGKAAIEAVLNPAESPFLFFVADGTGGHAFSETFAEHQRNVAKLRELERSRSNN